MVSTMKEQDLPNMVNKVVGEFQTESDFEVFAKVLRKQFFESSLEGEMDDQSAMKVAYLALRSVSKKWTMPIRNWKPALNRFTIEFGERVTAHL